MRADLHVCLLDDRDPQLLLVRRVGAHQLAAARDGQPVVDDDLAVYAVELELQHRKEV